MPTTQSAGTPTHSKGFQVHLQSLRDFADELRGQLQALGAVSSAVSSLRDHPVLLGDFLEADLLRARHEESVTRLQTLLEGTEDAIRFAEQVTDTVADAYRRGDQAVASSLAAVPGAVV